MPAPLERTVNEPGSGSLEHVQAGEEHDPDRVHEVPIHLPRRDREVAVLGEVAAQRSEEADEQENDARGDVSAVEARQNVEGRANGTTIRAKAIIDILVELDADKSRTEDDSGGQPHLQAPAVALGDAPARQVHRDAAGE